MTIQHRTIPLDSFDPLAAWLALGAPAPGFVESAMTHERIGRTSILPLRAPWRLRLDHRGLARVSGDREENQTGDLWRYLKDPLQRYDADSACLFPGGWFGLFGYDLAGQIEELPRRARRDLPVPELSLYWVDAVAVYHHADKRLELASLDAHLDLEPWIDILTRPPSLPANADPRVEAPRPVLAPEQFAAMVERARAYIAAGDIYQANISCRFDGRIDGPLWPLYHRLREVNPSPFAGLFVSPEVELASGSPERLVRLEGSLAETRPIAGTRPRGYTLPEDVRLGHELLGHPKERAEHIMLVDLERNDLGKVCRIGSVEVDELMVLERYSHVTHIVSNVRGQLRPECDAVDLVRAMFPGGTITGVPKKRCMEIIDELEPVGRGSYTGSLGYISVTGHLDLNILIRGFQRVGHHLSYQAGAGIVADSIAEMEWQECLNKGQALQVALQPFTS
ncbi:MAG: anthranilate synthase component I [Geothermobacteraceae bacterium]